MRLTRIVFMLAVVMILSGCITINCPKETSGEPFAKQEKQTKAVSIEQNASADMTTPVGKEWKCTKCGYVYDGVQPPDKCPVCVTDKGMFVEYFGDELSDWGKSKQPTLTGSSDTGVSGATRGGEPPICLDENINPNPNHTVVQTFFATDRNLTGKAKPSKIFGVSQSSLSYGTCTVSIPCGKRGHDIGKLESPSLWKFEWREDPNKHVVLLSTSIIQKDAFFTDLASRVNKSPRSNAFLFVHGFNVTFEDAARRTAQIAYDLSFEGAPVFYSWPSRGNPFPKAYRDDEKNIKWAQDNLKGFLEDFFTRTDAQNIYLIAHSMGNRALTLAVSSFLAEKPAFRSRLKEIILAAPDIDAKIFKTEIAPALIATGCPVTLYSSSKDTALTLSKIVNKGKPRAGDSGKGLVVLNWIETIDVTHIDTTILGLGHSYYAELRPILEDMYYLIGEGKRADQRFGLYRVNTEAGWFWKFRQ